MTVEIKHLPKNPSHILLKTVPEDFLSFRKPPAGGVRSLTASQHDPIEFQRVLRIGAQGVRLVAFRYHAVPAGNRLAVEKAVTAHNIVDNHRMRIEPVDQILFRVGNLIPQRLHKKLRLRVIRVGEEHHVFVVPLPVRRRVEFGGTFQIIELGKFRRLPDIGTFHRRIPFALFTIRTPELSYHNPARNRRTNC